MIKRIPGEPALERQQVKPMHKPVYTFDNQPTADALRQMAIRCMRDQLDIMWRAPKDLIFTTIPGRWVPTSKEKTTAYLGGKIYHGLPYARGGSALPQWYEYYNQVTGMLEFPGDGREFWAIHGHSCASCVLYSWYSVCNSLGGIFAQRMMVPKNGCFPVAPLQVPEGIDTYLEFPTDKIIAENGTAVLFEAYANVKPADALNTQPFNHVMMVIDAPHVVRLEDGSIDPDRSYITIQDQRSGNAKHESGFYEYLEDGIVERYSGRLSFDISFSRLCREGYIPLTTAEFMGIKPYEKATASFAGSTDSLADILAGNITANFPLCVVRLTLSDFAAREELSTKRLLKTDDITEGLGARYPLSLHETFLRQWEGRKNLHLLVQVVLTTNETFTVIDTRL